MKRLLVLICVFLLNVTLWAQPRVIGYFPYWAQYSQFYPKDIRFELITHVHYGYLIPVGDQLNFADPSDQQNFTALVEQATTKGVKVVGVVGGPGQADAMRASVAEPGLSSLAKNAATFAHNNGLSGLELDWTYTEAADATAFSAMAKAFATALHQVDPSLTLSATLAVGKEHQPIFTQETMSHLNYITVSASDEMSDAEATVKPNCNGKELAKALEDLSSNGISKDKIVAVIPFYGKSFIGAQGLGTSHKGVGSGNEGVLNYADLMTKFDTPEYKVTYDEATESEVAVSERETIVFNGIPSVKAVAKNVKANSYGGIAVYDLSGDAKQPIISLLVTIGKVLRPEINYKSKKQK